MLSPLSISYFFTLFSHNFPLFVGIDWGQNKFIFVLAIKMRKYLYIARKGSFSSFFFGISESFHLFHLPYVFVAIFALKTDFQCKILHLLLQSIEHPSIQLLIRWKHTYIYTYFIPHVWAIDSQLNSPPALCLCVYLGDAEIRFSIPMFSHFKWIW